jgi:hypothetical protein
VELTHGIYRAKTDADRKRREAFAKELFRTVAAHPVEVARLAERIHGEQMGRASASTSQTCSSELQPSISASMSPHSTCVTSKPCPASMSSSSEDDNR